MEALESRVTSTPFSCPEGGGHLYPVSNAFLNAVKANTRKYYWTGRITTTAGTVYEFDQDDMVKGSGYITSQCCGSTEIELGTVYAAEMGISLFSEINRYTLEDAKVELFYHLQVEGGSYEEVPMGIFEVSEANRKAKCLEIKAYDYMVRFEKAFTSLESIGNAYDFMVLCSTACEVTLAQDRATIEAMPNGTENLSIYSDNDIETYRDVLFYVGQVLGGFFVINRAGKLELRKYGNTPVLTVERKHRFSSSFSDFITRYTAVSSTNLRTQIAEYYSLDPDDGLTMNLGVNPLLQFGLEETRRQLCENILNDLAVVNYVDKRMPRSMPASHRTASRSAAGRVSSAWERIRSCPRRRVRTIRTFQGFWLRSRQERSGSIPSLTLQHFLWRMWTRRSFPSSLLRLKRTMRSSSGR